MFLGRQGRARVGRLPTSVRGPRASVETDARHTTGAPRAWLRDRYPEPAGVRPLQPTRKRMDAADGPHPLPHRHPCR